MDEINMVKSLGGADLNAAKTVLAFEATAIAHGQEEAIKAHQATIENFGVRNIPKELLPTSKVSRDVSLEAFSASISGIPHTELALSAFKEGIPAIDLFNTTGLAQSKGAARRLIQQGGCYINGERIDSVDCQVTADDIKDGEIVLRAGKKKYHTIKITA